MCKKFSNFDTEQNQIHNVWAVANEILPGRQLAAIITMTLSHRQSVTLTFDLAFP